MILVCLVVLCGRTTAVRGEDCNGNGVSDDQELSVNQTSPELSPIGDGFPQSYTLSQPPAAGSDVTLTFAAVADFGAAGFEYVDIDINGTLVGRVFDSGVNQCPVTPDIDELVVTAGDYNAAVAGGDAVITMTASIDMDATACATSSIMVTVAYSGRDCNANGILDECELDCNDNGVPDDCDIDPNDPDGDGRVFEDCTANGVPDVCEILYEIDNDHIVGVCDNCPEHYNPNQEDCDLDGIGDVCAIADGLVPDCDGNGVPDSCDLSINQTSPELSPIGDGFPQSYTLSQPPVATSDITLTFSAVADFGAAGFEYVDVDINGVPIGRVFDSGASQCPATPDIDELIVASVDYNAAVAGGDAVITMTASVDVDANACATSSIMVTVAYGRDCNANGIPDECEPDCNNNGIPDDCDIDANDPDGDNNVFEDCDTNGIPDVCEMLSDADGDGWVGVCDNCPALFNPDQADCDQDGIGDVCAIADGLAQDCDGNGVPDACDLAAGTFLDCNANGIPDVCELDCNANGFPDECDIAQCDPNDPSCQDCDGNGVPDSCDLTAGTFADCNANGIPDVCEVDCNENGVPDDCDITSGFSRDCDMNGVPDSCDIEGDSSLDCNGNGELDACDITDGVADDCNTNGVPDTCDLNTGASLDCNGNEIPDECDIESGLADDCDGDGALDICELVLCDPNDPTCADCNANGILDGCEPDCDGDGIPDDCEIAMCDPGDLACQDCDGNGLPDGCDADCDGDQIPDSCEISQGTAVDANGNGVPDECEDESESLSFTAVDSDGVRGDPGNIVLTHDFVGGFVLGQIDWSGSLTILEPQTLGGEAQVEIMHPSGVARTFQLNLMSQTIGGGPTYAESGAIPQQASPIARPFGLGLDPAGVWTFRFFETIDDGAPGAPDSRWDAFDLTLTTDLPSQPTPPTAEVLDLTGGSATTAGTLTAGEVKWFEFEIARAAAASASTYLDFDTFGSVLVNDNDTELAIYDAWGYVLASNDDAPGTLLSLISLGAGGGGDAVGQHGDAFAGVYYVALGAYNTSFADDFAASSTSPYTGTWQLSVATNTMLAGDVNGDCVVNITDLAIVLVSFGTTTGAALGDGDLTGDGAVNISDLAIVLASFGATCP